MYSDKENVNILTALLVAHGVRHAVVCPGSRNVPIVHNLNECFAVTCHPVTDERSAAFYALGMTQALAEPVAVCVTSGTALLNVAPAIAEAWYQHLPLIIISADRQQQWIDQLDGQTLPQDDALGRFVRKAVTLPEDGGWHCNRLVNEALLAATANDNPRPVHINVPIGEPLFQFNTKELPAARKITRAEGLRDYDSLIPQLADGLAAAERPMIVIGQTNPHDFDGSGTDWLFSHVIVLHEATATFPNVCHADEVIAAGAPEPPDFIIHIGGNIVSKRLRKYLRSATGAATWRICTSGDIEDTFQNLNAVIVGDPEAVLQSLSNSARWLPQRNDSTHTSPLAYRRQWLTALTKAAGHAANYSPEYSSMAAVRLFEESLPPQTPHHVHYANSTAIRMANIYARHHVWCNRGVSGIEGSLSTAAGFSVVTEEKVFCVIGDLSFFYDQNALWNSSLRGNLRIMLLNNGGGGIFHLLPGLERSTARDSLVAAAHHANAEGCCRQNDIVYIAAHNMDELQKGMAILMESEASRPVLLEVFTDMDTDEDVFKYYYKTQLSQV